MRQILVTTYPDALFCYECGYPLQGLPTSTQDMKRYARVRCRYLGCKNNGVVIRVSPHVKLMEVEEIADATAPANTTA